MAAAITYVGRQASTTNANTYTFNNSGSGWAIGAADASREVIVVVMWGDSLNNTTLDTTNTTIGGTSIGAGGLVVEEIDFDGASVYCGVEIIKRAVPTGTSIADIVVDFNAGNRRNCAIDVYYATGHDTTVVDTDVENAASGGVTFPTITTVADGFAIAGHVNSDGRSYTWTNITERGDATIESAIRGSSASIATSGTTLDASATLSGSATPERCGVIASWQAASGALSLTADAGSYALTGTNASTERGRRTTANAGSYALTGTNATTELGREVVAGGGTYALSGTDATVDFTRRLDATAGSYALTGTDAALEVGFRVAAAAGTYALTGNDVALLIEGDKVLVADAGSYALTGGDAELRLDRYTVAGTGSYLLTGSSVAFDPPIFFPGGGKIRPTRPPDNRRATRYTRERHEQFDKELRRAHEAQQRLERLAKKRAKAKYDAELREAIRDAAEQSRQAILEIDIYVGQQSLAALQQLTAFMDGIGKAQAQVDQIRMVEAAMRQAEMIKQLALREAEMQADADDEEAIAVLLVSQ